MKTTKNIPTALRLLIALVMSACALTFSAQVTDGLAGQDPEQESSLGTETGEVMYHITEKSSREEIESIKKKAEAVGIEFNYEMSRGDRRMKSIYAYIKPTEKNPKHCWQLTTGKYFTIDIGWRVDEAGDAVALIDGNSEPLVKRECLMDHDSPGIDAKTEANLAASILDIQPISNGLFSDTDVVSVQLKKGMTVGQYEAIKAAFSKAGIVHEFKEKNKTRTTVKLVMSIPGSTQSHQMKMEKDADWMIEVAWRADDDGRAIEFLELDDLE